MAGRCFVLCAVAVVAGCGDPTTTAMDAGDAGGAATARVPVLASVQPPEAPLFGPGFVLEAQGQFDADAVVVLDGRALTTRVTSSSVLEADVPADALDAVGTQSVRVIHTGSDGGSSREVGLRVVDGVALPIVGGLVPDKATVAAPDFELTVRGWNFYPTSVVHWAGAPRTTTYVDAGELRVTVTTADLGATGDVAVTVVTPDAAPSASSAFTIEAAPVAATVRLSVTPAGGDSAGIATAPAISADGRYVAFASTGNDLVAGDTARRDVFWRDTCRGATGCTPTTIRITEAMGGGDPNGDAQDPMISANGRYVAFASGASNLVAGDDTRVDVFVRDTCLGATGCTPSTVRVERPTISYSFAIYPSISGDGRYVAYTADTTSVWVADTCAGATGCTPSVARVDALNDNTPASRPAESPAISANGRYVAFKSNAPNLGFPQAGFTTHAYLLDTCAGATGCTRSLMRIDEPPDPGVEANGPVPVNSMAVGATGRYVTFSSLATNLTAAPTAGNYQVYLRDTCLGATGCTPSTTLISQTSLGEGGSANSMSSYLTPDGRYVIFGSRASDFVAGDTNGRDDVFVRDTCLGATGCTPATHIVSLGLGGVPSNDHAALGEYAPRISDDGLVTVWISRATNIVENDLNNQPDAFASTRAP